MAISKIKGTDKILASYWGYTGKGEYTNIRKRFESTREGKAQAMAWLVSESPNKKAPPKLIEDVRLRSIRDAIGYFISLSSFTARTEKSQRQEIYRLGGFQKWCDNKGLGYLMQFTQKHANEYTTYCQKAFERKGIEVRISLANRVFKSDIDRDDACLTKNPFRSVKKTGYDPRLAIAHLTKDQIDRAMSVLEPRKKAIMTILFETGMRADEFQHLRWSDITTYIDISCRTQTADVIGWEVKTGEAGGIPLTFNIRKSLEILKAENRKGQYVLLGDRPAHQTYLNIMFARFEEQVRELHPDIPHFSPKTLRASIAMYLLREKEGLPTVQRFLRHQSFNTTNKYYGRVVMEGLNSSVAILERSAAA